MKMRYDNKAFSSNIFNLAVKGYLKIEKGEDGYSLHDLKKSTNSLAQDEKVLKEKLFHEKSHIILNNLNFSIIQEAEYSLAVELKRHFENIYFHNNIRFFIFGLFLSVIITIVSVYMLNSDLPQSLFSSFCLFFLLGIFIRLISMASSINKLNSNGTLKKALKDMAYDNIIASLGLSGIFLVIIVILLNNSLFLGTILIIGYLINLLFYHLLKAATLLGRNITDKIEGFKLYLSVAEKQRLNFANVPENTLEVFERFLPYAIALDVENAWGDQFVEKFKQAGIDPQKYHPSWFIGDSPLGRVNILSLFSDSFTGVISSSLSPLEALPVWEEVRGEEEAAAVAAGDFR